MASMDDKQKDHNVATTEARELSLISVLPSLEGKMVGGGMVCTVMEAFKLLEKGLLISELQYVNISWWYMVFVLKEPVIISYHAWHEGPVV
jgi:hypothetical protein